MSKASGQGGGRRQQPPETTATEPTRLRSACDICHQSKVKCSGGSPCSGCERLGIQCNYSTSNRNGRPKGVKNKKTLQRIKGMTEANQSGSGNEEQAIESSPANELFATPLENGHIIESLESPAVNYFQLAEFDNLTKLGLLDLLTADDIGNSQGFPQLPEVLPQSPALSESSSYINFPTVSGATFRTSTHTDDPVAQKNPRAFTEVFSVGSSTTCDCLQQLAAQLVNLKGYCRQREEVIQADMALLYIRAAVSTWQQHFQCPLCEHTPDNDILVLSIIGIRTILPIIERVSNCTRPEEGHVLFSVKSSPAFTLPSTPVAYELAQEESQALMDILLSRNVVSIVDILRRIKERAVVYETFKGESSSTTSANTSSGGTISSYQRSPPLATFSSAFSPSISSELQGLLPSAELDCVFSLPTADDPQGYLRQCLESLMESAETLYSQLQQRRTRLTDNLR